MQPLHCDLHYGATEQHTWQCSARTLLASESIEAANCYIEDRRDTELHKVIKDQGIKKWLHKAFQDMAVGTQHLEPQGYAGTERSSAHVLVESGKTLCQHKQADGKAKRLVNPYATFEAPASAEHLPRGGHRPRPDPADFLAFALPSSIGPFQQHWPVPAMERRIQPPGAWIRAFIPACMTPSAVTSCAMKMALTQLTPLQVVLLLGGRFFCQVFRSTFCCVCIASLGGALPGCSTVECSATS